MAAQTSQSSSQLLKPLSYDYDVFLSFIVEDTNKDFTRCLRAKLEEARFYLRPAKSQDRFTPLRLSAGVGNIFTADLDMIRSSRISIVVFSIGYASSSGCLDELVEIVHCKNTKGQALIPIFYHVNPSDIQRETGTFWEAFTRQEEQFRTDTKRVQRWRAALTEAAHASGWVLEDVANRQAFTRQEQPEDVILTHMMRAPRGKAALTTEDEDANRQAFTRQKEEFRTDTKRAPRWKGALTIEAQHDSSWLLEDEYANRQEEEFRTDMERVPRWGAALHESAHALLWELEDEYENGSEKIYEIVQEVLDVLVVLKDSESMDSRVKMTKDLNLEASDICIVGMSWMGGDVNTILAKVVYNEICGGFEGSSFILNIREISRDSEYGLVHLQKILLYDILKMENVLSINNVYEGINLIEETIKGKRVLIVLDGVDDLRQLNALVGNTICFGPGSRVIATSGGEQLLTELEAHGKYEVQGLHYWNSLKLFSWRASMIGHDYKVKFDPEVNVYNYKQLDMAGEGSEKQMTSEPEAVVFGVEAVEITSNFDVLKILNLSLTTIKSLPESIVRLVNLKQLEVLNLEWTKIRDLPKNPRWPMLLELFLHNNKELRKIPPLFFDYMTALQTLNLSKTGISSLPKSIVKLVSLKRLILSGCGDFKKLSLEVGELKELEVLDLKGTEIWDLPENPRWPMLLQFVLHNNKELRKIPPLFFNYMTALQTLDLSSTGISSLPESVVKLVNLKSLILSCCDDFIELSPEVGELKQLEVLHLDGTKISDLPKNPRWPMLSELFLHNNMKLRKIPPFFFDYMTALQTLNLSKTGVRSLPDSVVGLVSLKRLFLSYCHRFMRLSPKVGKLKRLEVLDLEGTEIMDLPKEIMKLTNLTCLKFSIYGYRGDGSSAMQSNAPVPRNVISALSLLEELKISVNPDDKQCSEMVIKDIIVTEVCTLENLNTLHFYFPREDLVKHFISNSPMWEHPSRSHFRFTVGHHVKRIMPRLPREAELVLEKWERCLKYINGVAGPTEIKEVLQYSTAFFLEGHESVKKLSDFGIGNMWQLKCCVVGECNEVEVIIDEADVFKSLEYLCIYYMKNLRSIWRGLLQPLNLYFLKYLTLRTCPRLTTIFANGIIHYLRNLEELTVDDCPSITTIVSCETSAELKTSYHSLPKLKRMSLHYVPELISISSGFKIAPCLQWLSVYNCPNLKKLWDAEEFRKSLKRIEGEISWWEALYWGSGSPSHLDDIFVPIDILDC